MRPKKDKILHVRVSGQLDELIQRQADELKIPVSQLVRTLLEQRAHDFESWFKGGRDLAEAVAEDVTRVAGAVETVLGAPAFLTGKLKDRPKPVLRPDEIMGWQEVRVAKPVVCSGCQRVELKAQEKAAIAVYEGTRRYFFCPEFMAAQEAGEESFACQRKNAVAEEVEEESPAAESQA